MHKVNLNRRKTKPKNNTNMKINSLKNHRAFGKGLSISILSLCFWQGVDAGNIAYIHGDVANDGTIPSGNASPYDQMLLSDTRKNGMSIFKQMVEDEGHTISQYYDQNTNLTADFLSTFDLVIFGLHQKVWNDSEKLALDTWLRNGGSFFIYSDSASGGNHRTVGTDNPVGQTATNNLISDYGMQVTVDQTGGVQGYFSDPASTHTIDYDGLILEGEGVSPIAVDPNSDVEILFPYTSAFRAYGSGRLDRLQGITIENASYAALAIASVGSGHATVSFDRQPMWNNGPGSSIQEQGNKEVLRRLVNYLAIRDITQDPVEVSATAEFLVTTSGVATLRGAATNGQEYEWTQVSGPGSVVFESPTDLVTNASFSEPGTYELELIVSNGEQEDSTTVEIQVVDQASIIYALNCGSTALSAVTGIEYSDDNFYSNAGRVDDVGTTIVRGSEDALLYSSARSKVDSYQLPVEDGTYTVLVQFAETFWTSVNKRVFDMRAEGNLIIDDLDLFEVAGKLNAYDVIFEIPVMDGVLDLDFTASVNNMVINGIVVVGKSSLVVDETPGDENESDTSSGNSMPGFNMEKDILIAQFDSKPDPDDIHAIAALGSIINHPEMADLNYYAVAGAYGKQGDHNLYIPAPDLFNLAFGDKNITWTDAHNDYNNSVIRIKDKTKSVINDGGYVWVQEAGQSNITRDWLEALKNDGVSDDLIKQRVIVVQHSE